MELIFKGKPPKDIKCILNLQCLSGYFSFLPRKKEPIAQRSVGIPVFRTGKVKRKGGGEGDSGVAQETIIGGSMVSTYQTVPPVEKDGKKELLEPK